MRTAEVPALSGDDRPVCKWGPCQSKVVHVGWCGAHYRQYRLGEELRPVRGSAHYYASKLNERGEKQCTKCGYWLSTDMFYSRKDAGPNAKLRAHCNRCNILRRMSITARDYDDMLEAQGGGCAICGVAPETEARAFCVDHDHSCCPESKSCGECVRGILCNGCNAMLGMAGESLDRLMSGAAYLLERRDLLACPVR